MKSSWKRINTAKILIIFSLFLLIGCGKENDDKLTLGIICDMTAEKGEDLTWSDFEQYPSAEIGFGLYILLYEIDEDYQLRIGGVPDEKPMYMMLVSVKNGQSIDIRYDDICRNGHEGIGKPEPLTGNLSGYWSRRINDKERLIYKIDEENVYILACKYHYSDK